MPRNGWRAEHERQRLRQPPLSSSRARPPPASSSRFALPAGEARARRPNAQSEFVPNAFMRIAPDSTVTVISKHIEFGQGPYTGIATMLADELDADWAQIKRRVGAGRRREICQFRLRRCRAPAARPPWPTPGSSSARPAPRPARASSRRRPRPWDVDAGSITIEKGIVKDASGKTATLRRTRRPRTADRAVRAVQAEGARRLAA